MTLGKHAKRIHVLKCWGLLMIRTDQHAKNCFHFNSSGKFGIFPLSFSPILFDWWQIVLNRIKAPSAVEKLKWDKKKGFLVVSTWIYIWWIEGQLRNYVNVTMQYSSFVLIVHQISYFCQPISAIFIFALYYKQFVKIYFRPLHPKPYTLPFKFSSS